MVVVVGSVVVVVASVVVVVASVVVVVASVVVVVASMVVVAGGWEWVPLTCASGAICSPEGLPSLSKTISNH